MIKDNEEIYMGQDSGNGQVLGEATGYPFIYSHVYKTDKGTPYLRAPGVHLISKPQTCLDSLMTFLNGFDGDLGFIRYLDDPDKLADGEALVKFAGQACYASFGEKRTKNKDAAKYFENIKSSGHGSVVEHANYSFFVYGISRSLSHELVRHRAGLAVSQLSQRYVSGSVLRFVEGPECLGDELMHGKFCRWVDAAAEEYEARAVHLLERQTKGDVTLSAERKTDLRKKVQQAARKCLPNETETFMALTGNVRAWRHMCEMRCSEHADVEIRELYLRIYKCLRLVAPTLFEDYAVKQLSDGTYALDTPYRKV